MIVGAATEVLAGEGCIITAGGIDSHIHFICPQQIDEAISAGMSGLLDRTASERRIVSTILRSGPSTAEELQVVLHDIDGADLLSALALLKGDGAITEEDGRYRTVQKRATKSGAADILDRIGGL